MLSRPFVLIRLFALIFLLPAGNALAAKPPVAKHLGEGAEVEIGGEGTGQGKFSFIEDIVFDRHNRLYVLDGIHPSITKKGPSTATAWCRCSIKRDTSSTSSP